MILVSFSFAEDALSNDVKNMIFLARKVLQIYLQKVYIYTKLAYSFFQMHVYQCMDIHLRLLRN